jgi:hypothetical protein
MSTSPSTGPVAPVARLDDATLNPIFSREGASPSPVPANPRKSPETMPEPNPEASSNGRRPLRRRETDHRSTVGPERSPAAPTSPGRHRRRGASTTRMARLVAVTFALAGLVTACNCPPTIAKVRFDTNGTAPTVPSSTPSSTAAVQPGRGTQPSTATTRQATTSKSAPPTSTTTMPPATLPRGKLGIRP